jgi:hypothetical protein
MGHCGTLEHKTSCITAPYIGRIAGTYNTRYATQRETVSHCSPACILLDWAEQCLVIGNIMENRHEQTSSVEPYSSHRGSDILMAICLLAFLAMVGFGFVYAFPQFEQVAIIMAWVFLGLVFLVVGYLIWHKKRVDDINLQAIADENRRKNELHELQRETIQLPADISGNYPAIYNAKTQNVIVLQPGQFIQPVPNHYAPHFHYQDTSTRTGEAQAALSAPINQPSQDYLLSQLPENRLIVSPGVQLSDGKVVQASIIEVPHFKLLGASGFGKSCLAGSLLDQAMQLNSPDIFQVALLDLEHKTSRLFEDRPHVAQVRIGQRLIQMVATNADEVVEYLGYLTKELDRRAALSEAELNRLPILFMYVEEMLSLQYEVIDPKLLQMMFAALTILSVRGRKYGMFLLACMQTDYSTNELKVSQKMFRFRAAAAIDQTAARAAGFQNTELVKQNFQQGKPGQFVIEYPSFSQIVLAPIYDVKRLVGQKTAVHEVFTDEVFQPVKPTRNTVETSLKNSDETTWQAKVNAVRELHFQNWGKIATIERVWRVKAGGTQKYKDAEIEYEQIMAMIEESEA